MAVDWGVAVEEVCTVSTLDVGLGAGVDVPVIGNFLGCYAYFVHDQNFLGIF